MSWSIKDWYFWSTMSLQWAIARNHAAYVVFIKYLSISGHSKQSLFPTDKLNWSQRSKCFSWSWYLYFCPLYTTQLASVVVTPAIDCATSPCWEGPVIWPPVHPLHKLLVVLALEQVVAFVKAVDAFVISHELPNLLCNLQNGQKLFGFVLGPTRN